MSASNNTNICELPHVVMGEIIANLGPNAITSYASASTNTLDQVHHHCKLIPFKLTMRCTALTICLYVEDKAGRRMSFILRDKSEKRDSIEGEEEGVFHMDGHPVPVFSNKTLGQISSFWEDKKTGLRIVLKYLKATFTIPSVSLIFGFHTADEMLSLMNVAKDEKYVINSVKAKFDMLDIKLDEEIEKVAKCGIQSVGAAAVPRRAMGLEELPLWAVRHYHVTDTSSPIDVDALNKMKQCRSMILRNPRLNEEELSTFLVDWMDDRYQLQFFKIDGVKSLNLMPIINGVRHREEDPRTLGDLADSIVGKVYVLQKVDGTSFVAYRTESSIVIKKKE